MTLTALIPARSGSKGIPGKNLRMFDGKPLIAHSIEAALVAPGLDQVVVSTDSEEVARLAEKFATTVLWRDEVNSSDSATALDVVREVFRKLLTTETIVYLQPTSPLRTGKHIEEAVTVFLHGPYSSVVSVVEVPHNFLPSKQMRLVDDKLVSLEGTTFNTANRQSQGTLYARNGPAILITRRETVDAGSLYGATVGAYPMTALESFDIDTLSDFTIAEAVKQYLG